MTLSCDTLKFVTPDIFLYFSSGRGKTGNDVLIHLPLTILYFHITEEEKINWIAASDVCIDITAREQNVINVNSNFNWLPG